MLISDHEQAKSHAHRNVLSNRIQKSDLWLADDLQSSRNCIRLLNHYFEINECYLILLLSPKYWFEKSMLIFFGYTLDPRNQKNELLCCEWISHEFHWVHVGDKCTTIFFSIFILVFRKSVNFVTMQTETNFK